MKLPLFPCRRSAAGSLLLFLVLPLAVGSCTSDPGRRAEAMRSLARWEDARLAPADSLRNLLVDQDAHLRRAAARSAGLIGRTDVLPELVGLLQDPSGAVRAQAAFALGLLQDERALPALEEMARDSRADQREAALLALGRLPNPGIALLQAAGSEAPREAALAWDGLRNQVARVDSTAMHDALEAGLRNADPNVLWRVLRCFERAVQPDLAGDVIAHLGHGDDQVVVHACRALSHTADAVALRALIDAGDHFDRFRNRQRERTAIARLRAVGALSAQLEGLPEAEQQRRADEMAALLIQGAGDSSPFVGATALTAMSEWTRDLVLPPEAARQESLLPVWRIRMARAAHAHLDHRSLPVRRAACSAWADLRGSGATEELMGLLQHETDLPVRTAILGAVGRIHPAPLPALTVFLAPSRAAGERATALEALAHALRRTEPDTVPAWRRDEVLQLMGSAAADPDFVVAATAAGLLGRFPGPRQWEALCRSWDRPDDLQDRDVQLAVLGSFEQLGAPAQAAGIDSISTASTLERAAEILRGAFDSPDLRVRLAARRAALATRLLPERLIPTEPSLRATLPAFGRSPLQPPVAVPGSAPEVLCRSDRGEFTIRLDGRRAPNTCAAFVDLIGKGFYDGLTFHRVVPDFVAQGGDPRGDGWGGPGYTIRSEWSEAPYRRAAVGIAHSGKDTGGSQFFITLSEQPHLNGRYTVFGEVSGGMDVVDRLEAGDRFTLEIAGD